MNPLKALRAVVHHQLDQAHGAPSQMASHPISSEPLRGKEVHVRFEGIVPTDPFANVRVCVAQTAHYNPGHGLTLEDREAILQRESESLCRAFLARAEKLRATLSDDAPVIRASSRSRLPGGRST